MNQCEAINARGGRCRNLVSDGRRFCKAHKEKTDIVTWTLAAAGTVVGHLVLPGFGTVVGLLSGLTMSEFSGTKVMKKRVFISFDFDNDKIIKDFLVGQSKLADSPFEIVDHSLKEASAEATWVEKAKQAIIGCDLVVVMVGPETHQARGVLKEVELARAVNKPIVQVIGYKTGNYTAVPNAGKLYAWNWENLKKLFG